MATTSRQSIGIPAGEQAPARLARLHPSGPSARIRWIGAALALFAIYMALAFLNAERGYLGTDTGGKVATLEVMKHRHTNDPDVRYWAAEHDPGAELHPLWFTTRNGDRFVNVTTLPMLLVARPLYDNFGYRGTLIVPMIGGVVAALAAAALARRIGASPWLAFAAIGVASPVLIYSLDFWEHSWGVALMALGVAVAIDFRRNQRSARSGLLVGLLFGLGATMRTESLLYGAWCVAFFAGLVAVRERHVRRSAAFAVFALAGLLVPMVANGLLERALIGDATRSDRALGTARASGGSLALRIEESILTTVGLNSSDAPLGELLLGGLLVALTLAVVILSKRPDAVFRSRCKVVVAITTACALLLWMQGLRFLPGVLTASPLAAIGLLSVRGDNPRRELATFALGALPLVWLTQFTGGAAPQWGGRYVLLSGLVLGVLGLRELSDRPRLVVGWALAFSLATTAFGSAWMVRRTHVFDRAMEELARRDDEVLISTSGFLLREGGGYYDPERRWLSVSSKEQLKRALAMAAAVSAQKISILSVGEDPVDTGPEFTRLSVERVEFFAGLPLTIVTVTPAPAA